MTIAIFRCKRCGHEWAGRDSDKPKPVTCPKCRSPYWNVDRKKAK